MFFILSVKFWLLILCICILFFFSVLNILPLQGKENPGVFLLFFFSPIFTFLFQLKTLNWVLKTQYNKLIIFKWLNLCELREKLQTLVVVYDLWYFDVFQDYISHQSFSFHKIYFHLLSGVSFQIHSNFHGIIWK